MAYELNGHHHKWCIPQRQFPQRPTSGNFGQFFSQHCVDFAMDDGYFCFRWHATTPNVVPPDTLFDDVEREFKTTANYVLYRNVQERLAKEIAINEQWHTKLRDDQAKQMQCIEENTPFDDIELTGTFISAKQSDEFIVLLKQTVAQKFAEVQKEFAVRLSVAHNEALNAAMMEFDTIMDKLAELTSPHLDRLHALHEHFLSRDSALYVGRSGAEISRRAAQLQ